MSSMRGGDADLAAQISRLVERSPITADDIAAAVLEGIDRGDELVVPDEPARAAYALKLSDRKAYDEQMRATAARAKERDGRMSDPSVEVREEDAFDVPAMAAWLREHGSDVPDGTPDVRQFPGGASNLTYLLSYADRDLILRRPPSGVKAKSAHDMRREFTIQSKLQPVFGLVPGMVAFCDDQDVIGSDFYVMERLDGTILRRDLPDGPVAVRGRRPDALHELPRRARRPPPVDPSKAGPRRPRPGRRVRPPPGRRLVGPVPQGPHGQRRRLRAGDGLARPAAARRRRDHA